MCVIDITNWVKRMPALLSITIKCGEMKLLVFSRFSSYVLFFLMALILNGDTFQRTSTYANQLSAALNFTLSIWEYLWRIERGLI